MSTKALRVIALVLMILVCVWLGARLLSHGSDVVRGRLALPAMHKEQTDSVIIRHGADTVRLARTGTTWTVNGFRADAEAVGQLFLAFHDTATPELAAVSRSSFERMGVDSSNGYWLDVWSGGRSALRLIIGKQGMAPSSGYLRRTGSDSILMWRGDLIDVTRRQVTQWRDKHIAAVAPESVFAIDVTARRPYVLRRGGSTWRFSGGGAVDSGKVAGMLAIYRDFAASGFGTPALADSGKKAAARRRVTLIGADGATRLQVAFDSSATGVWARRSGDDNIYRVDAWRLNAFAPPDTALRPAPLPKATGPAHR